MEAYFLDDKKIIEWVDLIIEKLLTFSLLKNEELSAKDIDEVSQAIANISDALQKITPLSPQALTEVINQLVKQRLPEDKVMNHFADFYDYLNKFLSPGPEHPRQTPSIGDIEKTVAETSLIAEHPTVVNQLADPQRPETTIFLENLTANVDSPQQGVENDQSADSCVAQYEPFSGHDQATAALAGMDHETFGPMNTHHVKQNITTTQKACPLDSKILLQNVLRHFYPSAKINWNVDLAGHTFFAQVEDLLVYLAEPARDQIQQISTDLAAQGWKVIICSQEDLRFPKRLERNIKAVLRSSKIKVMHR